MVQAGCRGYTGYRQGAEATGYRQGTEAIQGTGRVQGTEIVVSASALLLPTKKAGCARRLRYKYTKAGVVWLIRRVGRNRMYKPYMTYI
jgi:hypothetical protein